MEISCLVQEDGCRESSPAKLEGQCIQYTYLSTHEIDVQKLLLALFR